MIGSKNCLDLIKSSEGCVLHGYYDPASGNLPITAGYGSTTKSDGTKFKFGEQITQAQADSFLQYEVTEKSKQVTKLLGSVVLNQNQFDAIISLTYNIGVGAFADSTLLKRIKVDPQGINITDAFLMWNKAKIKGKFIVMAGLTIRRRNESLLYFLK